MTVSVLVLQDVIITSHTWVLHRLSWECNCSYVLSGIKNESAKFYKISSMLTKIMLKNHWLCFFCRHSVVNLMTVEPKTMHAVSALVVVFLGALIHRSYAIKCYVCVSADGDHCDDFDKDHHGVKVVNCASKYNACSSFTGSYKKGKNTSCTSDAVLVGFFFIVLPVALCCQFRISSSCRKWSNGPLPVSWQSICPPTIYYRASSQRIGRDTRLKQQYCAFCRTLYCL